MRISAMINTLGQWIDSQTRLNELRVKLDSEQTLWRNDQDERWQKQESRWATQRLINAVIIGFLFAFFMSVAVPDWRYRAKHGISIWAAPKDPWTDADRKVSVPNPESK